MRSCLACGIPLLSRREHAALATDQRALSARHGGRGYCQRCYDQCRTEVEEPRLTSLANIKTWECSYCGQPTTTRTALQRFPSLRGQYRENRKGDLCQRCYGRSLKSGALDLRVRKADEVLDDWAMMRDDENPTIKAAAERLGMKWKTLEKALYRARKRGDSRGSLVPFGHDMRSAT